jgi:hypothetical protein
MEPLVIVMLVCVTTGVVRQFVLKSNQTPPAGWKEIKEKEDAYGDAFDRGRNVASRREQK